MAIYRIQAPDGSILRIEGPDDATEAELQDAASKAFQPAEKSMGGKIAQQAGNVAAGLVRGAGSIGATLLAPVDVARDLAAGKGLTLESNRQRRADMDAALASLGAETDSFAYGAGKLGGELAGTAGVGGVVANALTRMAPQAVNMANAVRTAGMTGGNMATRTAGGAITGGLSAGLVNPEDVALGAGVGAALPGALGAAGRAGNAVGRAFRGKEKRAAEEVAAALNVRMEDLPAIVQSLRQAEELVPGSRPTVAQALQSPQAGVLQRVVSDSAGGSALRDVLASQNAARMAALEGVAPTVPTGVATARDDLGRSIIKAAQAGDAAAKQRTRDLFNQVPLDDASIYLPLDRISGAQGKYFGAGSFGDRSSVDEAVKTALAIGQESAPSVLPTTATSRGAQTLAQAVRKAGGLSITDNSGLRGEVAGLSGDLKNLVRRNGGMSPANMAERMYEAGYIADDSTEALFDALRGESRGVASYSSVDDLSRQFGAMRDAAMGDAPEAMAIPKLTTLREVQNYRSALGAEARKAAQVGDDKTAAALGEMRQAIDDRIDEVVRGDGGMDENLPIDWANKLSEALKAKRDQVAQFRTGPQAELFRRGRDGAPTVQGGEAASLFWGSSRPGLADDVESFKRLIGDNPRLLGQFRSMVTTEGASTATAGGNLSSKFVRWVENTLPGLKKTFEPEQVRTLERIAQDIKRAEGAAAAGMSRGSNTYQNAANALNLGLLDSPMVNMLANRIPVIGQFTGPALEGVRNSARASKATRLADALSDSQRAALLLESLSQPQINALAIDPALLQFGYRSAPVLAGDL